MPVSEYTDVFRGSAMKRAKRSGLRRNAAVALGNIGSPLDVALLVSTLSDEDPLVRLHSAWALGRIGSDDAIVALRERLNLEEDPSVVDSIRGSIEFIVR